jgi:hypothetical protein
MPAEAASQNSLQTRIVSLQTVTLVWMTVECAVALFAAWRARSVSLLAFGHTERLTARYSKLIGFGPLADLTHSKKLSAGTMHRPVLNLSLQKLAVSIPSERALKRSRS